MSLIRNEKNHCFVAKVATKDTQRLLALMYSANTVISFVLLPLFRVS